jgi:hypothetical protein
MARDSAVTMTYTKVTIATILIYKDTLILDSTEKFTTTTNPSESASISATEAIVTSTSSYEPTSISSTEAIVTSTSSYKLTSISTTVAIVTSTSSYEPTSISSTLAIVTSTSSYKPTSISSTVAIDQPKFEKLEYCFEMAHSDLSVFNKIIGKLNINYNNQNLILRVIGEDEKYFKINQDYMIIYNGSSDSLKKVFEFEACVSAQISMLESCANIIVKFGEKCSNRCRLKAH